MYFASRKDLFYAVVIWGFSIVTLSLYLIGPSAPKTALLMVGTVITLFMWMWFGTGYRLEDGKIHVRCGPFHMKVKIDEIKKIQRTRNPFTAPTLSVDRLDIMYGFYKTIQISPENEEEFLRLLLQENPQIEWDEKQKRTQ